MESKDINEYIEDRIRWVFYMDTDAEKDKDIEKEILDVYLLHNSEKETKKYLNDKYDDKYYLSSLSSNGGSIDRVHLLKKINGNLLRVRYKGFRIETFWENDKLLKIHYKDYELLTIKVTTLEDIYDWIIKKIKAEKRQVMNKYNKEIKALKQEYKKELKKYNFLLNKEKGNN